MAVEVPTRPLMATKGSGGERMLQLFLYPEELTMELRDFKE